MGDANKEDDMVVMGYPWNTRSQADNAKALADRLAQERRKRLNLRIYGTED